MTDHIVSRLTTKRAELARLITDLEREIDQYRADLTHIDGALRVLSADLDPESIPPRQRYALPRLCLSGTTAEIDERARASISSYTHSAV